MIEEHAIQVNGIYYAIEVSHGGSAVHVRDKAGAVASAKKDSETEDVCYAYLETDRGVLEAHSGSLPALYHESPLYIARWLINTHPSN